MGEKGVGKLSRETPPSREGEPMGAATLPGAWRCRVSAGTGRSGVSIL